MLYGYTKPVFVDSNSPLTSFIFGIKITWYQQDSSHARPLSDSTLTEGKTFLYDLSFSAEDATLTLKVAAQHPFIKNLYYYKQVYINKSFTYDTEPLKTLDEATMLTHDDLVFDVVHDAGLNGIGCAHTKDVTLVCDFAGLRSYLEDNQSPMVEIEPFNVVFDVLDSSARSSLNDITITNTVENVDELKITRSLANTIFTNDPIDDKSDKIGRAHV